MLKQKKGEVVAIVGFTGIRLGDQEVTAATKETITVTKKNGDEMVFDRKSGKQTNCEKGKEKYANTAMNLDEAPENKKREEKNDKKKGKKEDKSEKKSSKKPAKKPEPEEDDEDDFEDDDDDFEDDEE